MDNGHLLLSVDGGQTATKSLVARLDGTVLGAGLGGPSDHFHIEGGIEKNRKAILGAIDDALAAVDASPDSVAAIALGLTGAPAGSSAPGIVDEIVRERLTASQITVVPDYVTNLAGASGGTPGVVLIAGGGAIGYGITEDGRYAISGGFGYLLGDEGSAFHIGKRAIAAASYAADRRGEPTMLEGIVTQHFDISQPRDLPWIVYAAGFSRERISLLAPKVVQAANAGDAVAIAILCEAGEELATLALGVLRQLFPPGTAAAVYPTGGVFQAGDLLMGPFRARLEREWPAAQPHLPRFPPAVGGLILAARSIGISVDDAWLDTVASTLPAVGRVTK